jgi:hypothetical protein
MDNKPNLNSNTFTKKPNLSKNPKNLNEEVPLSIPIPQKNYSTQRNYSLYTNKGNHLD